jgi:hypothetical protein
MFTLHWTFRNDHAWQWSSTSLNEVFDYMYKTQILYTPRCYLPCYQA